MQTQQNSSHTTKFGQGGSHCLCLAGCLGKQTKAGASRDRISPQPSKGFLFERDFRGVRRQEKKSGSIW